VKPKLPKIDRPTRYQIETKLFGARRIKKFRQMELDLARHYALRGVTNWRYSQFVALAATLGITTRLLAYVCGWPMDDGKRIRGWESKGKIPGPVSLHAAIIKQFIDFKLTGTLEGPIIPLDWVMGDKPTRRLSLLKKFRRRERRRTAKIREASLKNLNMGNNKTK
jgi:hypothetical protein